ncbi:class I SAM-dependent methyltransferase [Moorena sp. SIO3H5]|uniref:class I SAM-dependent methyltransferase n=1 Tax=Moorena sp. SIO3H5 TaxID=2607834 RepID=UPI0025FBBB22|nr:class I SAM-dependent methyltransferase [Moorena sp. SIO3H5]
MEKLTGIPETMLWTLHNRANEAMRSDGVIQDPKAIEIYEAIQYDYERSRSVTKGQSFGKADPVHALRSIAFDSEIRVFMKKYPSGVVVNLGEGLETQRFRLADLQTTWYTIDLPESIRAREHFISPGDRWKHISCSALDYAWIDQIPTDRPVCITAQGLLMYFQESEVQDLLKTLAERHPILTIIFDVIPNWLAQKTLSSDGLKMSRDYVTPVMPWGINRKEIPSFIEKTMGQNFDVTDIGFPRYPLAIRSFLFWVWFNVPVLKQLAPTIVKVER